MKNLLLIFTLLFSTVFFSSPSYAGWTKVGENVDGTNYYVNFERIRKHDGFVYFWYLTDYLKPDGYGEISNKYYTEGDCKLFRYRRLSSNYYKEPMGGGTPEVHNPKNPKWTYPHPNTPIESTLKQVCNR